MTQTLRLTRAAEQDLVLARAWYLERAPHVVKVFERELRAGYARIAERPEMDRLVEGGVRHAAIRRFPFSLYYRVEADLIEIIGILHQARDPRSWRQRL